MILTIITFIIVLSVLVFAHELGHFWVAKKAGIIPKEFGFGFPPRAWGIYKDANGKWKQVRGKKEVEDAVGTIYSVNWVPLGGFVNLEEDEEGGDNPNHFSNKKIWQRAVILLAGVTMNIILAAILFSVGYMVGLPQALDDVSEKAHVSNRQIQIIEVLSDSPAEVAGLELGDMIVSLDDKQFTNYNQLQGYVDENKGKKITYEIKRGGEVIALEITPEKRPETGKGGVGISIAEIGIVRYPILLSIWEGFKTTILLTWLIIIAFYTLIKGLILGQGLSIELGGPVRIAQMTGDVMRMGFAYLINFTAILSINLAIINALQFPALDGGRILFLIIEKIKGSPVKKEVEGIIHYIGFALLMLLIVLVTYRDIARFWQ